MKCLVIDKLSAWNGSIFFLISFHCYWLWGNMDHSPLLSYIVCLLYEVMMLHYHENFRYPPLLKWKSTLFHMMMMNKFTNNVHVREWRILTSDILFQDVTLTSIERCPNQWYDAFIDLYFVDWFIMKYTNLLSSW